MNILATFLFVQHALYRDHYVTGLSNSIRKEGLRQKFANKYGIFLILCFHFNEIYIFY